VEKETDITISFAGDLTLARDVYRYFMSRYGFSAYATTEIIEDEIRIQFKKNSDMAQAKVLLKQEINDYLQSSGLVRQKITEFNNVIVVGIPKDIGDISNLLMCEICGWRVTTEEELLTHRRTHWI